ncbi:MAG TPA: universal stress protein [Ktedonobacterales bacterium]
MSDERKGLGTVLVPLDGSEEAERAIPMAVRIARATRSPLLMVRVIPLMVWTTSIVAGGGVTGETLQQIVDEEDRSVAEYLRERTHALRDEGIEVRTLALRGAPAPTLIDLEPEEGVGLVVMTTHGRTGLPRFALGSVADQLVRYGRVPVLLLRSFGVECSSDALNHALIALDGSARAEQVFKLSKMLAGSIVREITLARVVDAEASEAQAAEAARYLDEVSARYGVELGGIGRTLSTRVLRGVVAEEILKQAESGCNLLVIATHGRTGPARWALGSVADRVVHAAKVPVLLVRTVPE